MLGFADRQRELRCAESRVTCYEAYMYRVGVDSDSLGHGCDRGGRSFLVSHRHMMHAVLQITVSGKIRCSRTPSVRSPEFTDVTTCDYARTLHEVLTRAHLMEENQS